MDAVLKWIGIVGAVWLAVSILAAVFWAAGGRRIFRKPPSPLQRPSGPQIIGKPSKVQINGVDLTPYVIWDKTSERGDR